MKLANLFKPQPEPAAPARPAYDALKQTLERLLALRIRQNETARLAEVERAEVAAATAARAAVTSLEDQRIAALAETELTGRDMNIDGIELQLKGARSRLAALGERGAIAKFKFDRLTADHQRMNAEATEMNKVIPRLRHDARNERLGELMAVYLEAETAFCEALADVYGAVGSLNRMHEEDTDHRHGFPILERWNSSGFILQRPQHRLYNHIPYPRREDIDARIKATQDGIIAEL